MNSDINRPLRSAKMKQNSANNVNMVTSTIFHAQVKEDILFSRFSSSYWYFSSVRIDLIVRTHVNVDLKGKESVNIGERFIKQINNNSILFQHIE